MTESPEQTRKLPENIAMAEGGQMILYYPYSVVRSAPPEGTEDPVIFRVTHMPTGRVVQEYVGESREHEATLHAQQLNKAEEGKQ